MSNNLPTRYNPNQKAPMSLGRGISLTMSRDLPKYFTKDEVYRILYKNRGRWQREYDRRFLCWFLWQTGARISEALTLTVSSFDPSAKVVVLPTLKKRNKRVVYRQLPKPDDTFWQELYAWTEYKNIHARTAWMFPVPGNAIQHIDRKMAHYYIQRACMQAGMDKKLAHPHTFRHSFAVNCILNGVKPVTLQQWLGHSDIMSTMIYMKVTGRDTMNEAEGVEF